MRIGRPLPVALTTDAALTSTVGEAMANDAGQVRGTADGRNLLRQERVVHPRHRRTVTSGCWA